MSRASVKTSRSMSRGISESAKPPLRPKHVWYIRTKLQVEGRTRDLALFNVAIDSKLRGCDVVAPQSRRGRSKRLCGRPRKRPTEENGTLGQIRTYRVTRQTIDDYLRAIGKKPGEYLFPGRRGPERSLTTRQYARLFSDWLAGIGLDPHLFGTHSLRRTEATLIYRRTGNLRAVQLLLGHTKLESTVRYFEIEVDDALAIAEQVNV